MRATPGIRGRSQRPRQPSQALTGPPTSAVAATTTGGLDTSTHPRHHHHGQPSTHFDMGGGRGLERRNARQELRPPVPCLSRCSAGFSSSSTAGLHVSHWVSERRLGSGALWCAGQCVWELAGARRKRARVQGCPPIFILDQGARGAVDGCGMAWHGMAWAAWMAGQQQPLQQPGPAFAEQAAHPSTIHPASQQSPASSSSGQPSGSGNNTARASASAMEPWNAPGAPGSHSPIPTNSARLVVAS